MGVRFLDGLPKGPIFPLFPSHGPDWSWDARSGVLPSGSTFSRASSAWYFNASGSLVSASSNVARFAFDPATHLAHGYLSEASSTNGIRNNTMVGVAAGTPGTAPTNWSIGGLGGLSSTIVGSGTLNGIPYVDIRYFGTATGGGYAAVFDTSSAIASAQGQTWTASAYLALVGGSFANITIMNFDNVSYPGGNDNSTANFLSSITSTLQRFSGTTTIPNVGNTNIQPRLSYSVTPGAVDFTLRIGLPQMEQSASATSPILTSGTAATRATDILTLPLSSLPGWRADAAGVLVATYRIYSPRSTMGVAAIVDSGAFANTILLYENFGGAGSARFNTNSTNLIQLSGATSPSAFIRRRTAVAWGSTQMIAHDGTSDGSTTGQIPTSLVNLRLGTDDGTAPLNGTLESVQYYSGARAASFVTMVSK